MRRTILLILSLLCLLAAAALTWQAWGGYQQARAVLPAGSRLAGLPVGGLDAQAAGLRVAQVYGQTPVELVAGAQRIHITPEQAGFTLDLPAMLAAAQDGAAWSFADYLFGRPRPAPDAPLAADLDEARLQTYLREEIAPRLEQPAAAPRPSGPGELSMTPGRPGVTAGLDQAREEIAAAFFSTRQRVVDVALRGVPPPPPDFADLEPMLEAVLQSMGFEGAVELYLQDVATGQSVQIAYNQGRRIAPGIAFTAASTIKVPVMVSAYRRIDGDLPPELARQMALMIDLSENTSTDEVMQLAINSVNAPLIVTDDMRALGLQNTFLAGYFYPGAALLDLISTPANQRADVNTDPDLYNQTTPADIGWLLAAIETCAGGGRGPLIDVFAGEVTQAECQEMTALLKANRKAVLLEAGLPEGTPLAHKYGWVTDFRDGLLHTASDAGVVYAPRGPFVLAVYLYDSRQLHWDPAQLLVARLVRAAYEFYAVE